MGAIATGLMGLTLEPVEPDKTLTHSGYVEYLITTTPRLTGATKWVELNHVPARVNEINLRHDGATRTALENAGGPSLQWRACFPGQSKELIVNGISVPAKPYTATAESLSCAIVTVGPGERITAQRPELK